MWTSFPPEPCGPSARVPTKPGQLHGWVRAPAVLYDVQVGTSGSIARAATTLLAGVLAAHELQSLITYSGDVHQALDHQGHPYLAVVTPVVGAALAVGLTSLFVLLARAWSSKRSVLSRRRVWLAASVALLTIYVAQEALEGWLAAGHTAGVAGVLGKGGLVALVLAGGVAGLVTFALGAASLAVALVPPVLPLRPRLLVPLTLEPGAPAAIAPRTRGLARPQSSRAPPSAPLSI